MYVYINRGFLSTFMLVVREVYLLNRKNVAVKHVL